MFLRIFRGQGFRESLPFLTPFPMVTVVLSASPPDETSGCDESSAFSVACGPFRTKKGINRNSRGPVNENKDQVMLLRTALMSFAAFAFCQIGYGQSGTPSTPAANASPRAVRSVSNHPAAAAPVHAAAPAAMATGPQMDYGLDTMPPDGCSAGPACNDSGCAPGTGNYVPWWHRHFVWSYWKAHGLPSPWCPPGNLTLHIPDTACGSTYYYFRPYNGFHISDQQAEVANYEGDPRNPYDNRATFDGLYEGL
jgi:hypothetical protein